MSIRLHLDRALVARRMSLAELSDRVGIKASDLALLRSGQALAIRFATLDALCRELACQPADLMSYGVGEPED